MAENVNANDDIYVRKEVFDARMDRMEMLLEKTVIEIKAYVDGAITEIKAEIRELKAETHKEISELRAETRQEIGGLRNDIRLLNTRVDSLENVFYWGLGGFGIILASAVIVPAMLGFLKKLFQPAVTLEDVEKIVNAAINKHLSGGKSE